MEEQEVILVTEEDEPIGTMEKMQAHRQGVLHRAFSIFIFDSKGRMLLQQRAAGKYHGANLWSNTCCSHPFPGEDTGSAASRRLQEELGFGTSLKQIFNFTYRANVENNLIEHEFDHVFTGEWSGPVAVNKSEVQDFCYLSFTELKKAIQEHPGKFTSWFKLIFPRLADWWQQEYKEPVMMNSK